MNKYECFFEESHKNVYFEIQPYDSNNTVKLSITAYQGEDNIIEVCLTNNQIEKLIDELSEYTRKY